MRTYGKNDFSDFKYIDETTYGKLYNAKEVDTGCIRTIHIIEESSIKGALNILRDAFLYSSMKHKNVLDFNGCFLNEIAEVSEESQKTFQVGIITENYSHSTLAQLIEAKRVPGHKFSEAEIWRILSQLVDVLSYCQSHDVYHMDIRPDNIFIDDQNNIKISYFGEAKFRNYLHYHKTMTNFLAPNKVEIFEKDSKRVSANTAKEDLYSLGLTILNLLYKGSTYDINRDKSGEKLGAILTGNVRKEYSETLAHTIEMALQYEEEERPDFIQFQKYLNDEIHIKEKFIEEAKSPDHQVVQESVKADLGGSPSELKIDSAAAGLRKNSEIHKHPTSLQQRKTELFKKKHAEGDQIERKATSEAPEIRGENNEGK